MRTFSGSRLALARKRRGLTKKYIAESVGISSAALSSYESEESPKSPSAATLASLAHILGFPEEFFFLEDIEPIRAEIVNFRARTKMTRKQRDCSLASGDLAVILNGWIADRFSLPSANLPNCENIDPETAAIFVRSCWSLGSLPIRHMIDILELHGVRVFSLPEKHIAIDAFSFWDENTGTPYILLNTLKSGERGRMDAAHELGHLVMHRHVNLNDPNRDIEAEANKFASHFLMPSCDVRLYKYQHASIDDLITIKKRWQVSLSALIYRLKQLDLLSDWKYHSLYRQISAKGMRTKEPNPIEREKSQVLSKIAEALDNEGVGLFAIANELSVPYEEVCQLMFRLPIRVMRNKASSKLYLMKSTTVREE